MDDLKTTVDKGRKVRQCHFGPTICFSYPSQTLSIIVTGDKCQLNCAHYVGHYLQHMKALQEERGLCVVAIEPKRFLSSRKDPALGQELIKDILIQLARPMLVGIGQRRKLGCCIYTEVHKLS
jgi:hypothetical protein